MVLGALLNRLRFNRFAKAADPCRSALVNRAGFAPRERRSIRRRAARVALSTELFLKAFFGQPSLFPDPATQIQNSAAIFTSLAVNEAFI